MWEKLIVLAIVLAAVVYTVRRMIRTGKKSSCGCGCSSCSIAPAEKKKCGL
ncbi:MAG: FeoB-associated Cys-rich membrane protein [Thermodesulfobacteriota bacterium]